MTSPSPFALVTTGGTIDAACYDTTPHTIRPLRESLVPKALEEMGLTAGVDFTHLPFSQADSKYFLTDSQLAEEQAKPVPLPKLEQRRIDMDAFISYLLAQAESQLLITHGSDAVVRTALTLWQDARIRASGKTIIFTLAMQPLANSYRGNDWHSEADPLRAAYDFAGCDGTANLQRAVTHLQRRDLPPGVHLLANKGTFIASNEALTRARKDYNTPRAAERYFYFVE